MTLPIPRLAPAPRADPAAPKRGAPVSVTLLTGFLGAGKTTLLNRILNGGHGLRVGVLVNDFGAINIDAELIEGIEENTISLTNGCVCCEIRDDLVDSLELLLGRADAIDYVVIEASGVADPEGIVMTLLNSRYERLLRMDTVTCVVDAEAVFSQGDNEALNMLKLRQIGFADMVVLNKTDLVGPEHVQVIKEWIDHHFRRIRIIEGTRCDVPLEILLAVGRFDPRHALDMTAERTSESQPHSARKMFETWSYECDRPLSIDALRRLVRRELPASVYRCKGIIYAAESPAKRFALQVVGRRTEVHELEDWGERAPRTRIVAIGSSIDSDALRAQFDACVDST